MCVYSMVADHYKDQFMQPGGIGWGIIHDKPPPVSKAEFDELKRKVEEMAELLRKAADYDKRNNEPDCEMEDKIALLRKVAEFVGIPDAVKSPHA